MQRIMLKNAVLIKDMNLKAKKKNMAISFFLLNTVMSIGFLFFLLANNVNLANFRSFDMQVFTWIFDGFIIVECAMICILVPTETGPAIANERERQTLDVLLTTNMSNTDIILGKYMSSVIYSLLTIASLLPFLAVLLVYGGISLWQLIAITLTVIATAMYLSTFGIYFSTVVKKSSRASAVNVAIVFLIVIGSIVATVIIRAIGAAYVRYSPNPMTHNIFVTGDWIFVLLYLNPASTVFDLLDKLVGFTDISDYKGMASIIRVFSGISPNNFFIKHWWFFGYLLQFSLGGFMLNKASVALTKTKVRKKHGKNDR